MSSESAPDRKKRMNTAVSIFNRISGASASMRSRGSSMLSKYQREMMGFRESDTVGCRDWLFAVVECMLAFSWNCFGARKSSQENMEMRGLAPREDTMDTLFWLGLASFSNIIVGQLMDSATGYYLMALLNIVLHFTLASLFLINEIVRETSSEDVYAHLLSHVYLVIYFPIKATGFTRYVYAMDQVGAGKGSEFIIHYTFMFGFFALSGKLLFAIVQDTEPSTALLSAIAFCFNGTVLFLYSYIFLPRPRMIVTAPPDAAMKIWGVLFTALRNKRRFGGKVKRHEWLDYAENKYDKPQIVRSRRIFRLFLMITPTTGFLLFVVYQGIIFQSFYDDLKFSGPNVPRYIKWIIPVTSLMVVSFVEYGLIPLLRTCKFKVDFLRRFLMGYMSMLFAVSVAAIITTKTEKLHIRPSSGTLRVYNTMDGNVTFRSMQSEFTKLHFIVPAHLHFEASFAARDEILFRLAVTFVRPTVGDDVIGNVTSYTQLFSVAPEAVLQYVTVAPSTIIRVPGHLPIKQGPPGQNDAGKPRCFIVSLIGDRMQTVNVINDKTNKWHKFDVYPGKVVMFQVEEGNYTLRYSTSISQTTNSMLESGGLYGIYLFLGLNEYEIDVDKIVPENTRHALTALAVSIPMTFAQIFGEIPLDAFVYVTAPEGLKGLAFGFYLYCKHTPAWFLLIGFHTWHHYITPDVILLYALLALVTFFFCLVLLIRYKNHYAM